MSHLVLGISAFYHDSAAALVRDGIVIAAAQEERFTRRKHDPRFPESAINYCLEEAFVDPSELDEVVFYDRPLLTFDRALKNVLQLGEPGRGQLQAMTTSLLGTKVHVEEIARRALGTVGRKDRIVFCEHHAAHAASAFYPSPFPEAAILTIDGVGEWATLTVGRGGPDGIETLRQIDYPHSLGLLYSAATHYCGFKVNSGEYKLMGLAPYGEPRFEDVIRESLIDLREDGSFRLHTDRFAFLEGGAMTDERFEDLFGAPRRSPDAPITRHYMDVAASFQRVTESAMLALADQAHALTGSPNLVLAGGVALNCVGNGRVLREGPFRSVWIQPAAGDAGGALGAALQVAHDAGMPRPWIGSSDPDGQAGSYLGPAWSSAEIRAFLERRAIPFDHLPEPDARAARVADAIAQGDVVGFFSGRMEFGPRALGARSILGDPGRADTQTTMNLRIKFRESFRPFAPSVLEEEAAEHFELESTSPYMLLVAGVRPEHRLPFDASARDDDDLLPLIATPRSHLPAITHVDYSARVQTVGTHTHPDYRRLIEAVRERTGHGVVVNTSFNVRGEPIVCSPDDAYRCFMRTDMDLLVLEDFVIEKSRQPTSVEDETWKERLRAEDEGEDGLVPAPEAEQPGDAELASAIDHLWSGPLAEAVGRTFMPLGPDPDLTTYYRDREGEQGDAVVDADLSTAEGIERELRRIWSSADDSALAASAAEFARLAVHLRPRSGSSGEISDLVYTLF